MVIDRPKVIASNAVRRFVANGGTLRFVAVDSDGGRGWAVVAISADGEELPVVLSHVVAPKILRSHTAVAAYHRKMCPAEKAVVIPHHLDDAADHADVESAPED